jgi:AcrR family transcriptional regulator
MLPPMNDLKARISLTAQELFLSEGVEGVSMRKIADRVGVTATAIYRHFRDKDEILEELIDAGLAILSEYLGPALKAEDPYRRLRGLIDAYLRFAMEQPKYFDLAFLVPGPTIQFSQDLEHHSRATFKLAVEQVALCMETGIFRKGDPIETAIYLWSTAHGLVMLHRMNRLGDDVQHSSRLCRSTIERAIQGLRERG